MQKFFTTKIFRSWWEFLTTHEILHQGNIIKWHVKFFGTEIFMFREIFLTKIVVLNQKNITWEDVAGKIAILYQENMDMI